MNGTRKKMKKLIKISDDSPYNAFEIVLVPFPFIDSAQTKKRPAMILSSAQHFNTASESCVMAMITSKAHTPWPLDLEITDLPSAGLPVKSIIRMKFFTLSQSLIIKKLGILSSMDQKAISKTLKILFPEFSLGHIT